jgi:hypothetical protein
VTPPLPEREIPFRTEGRPLVLLVYPVEPAPAPHRPLCVAAAVDGGSPYVATAVLTQRQVHVLDGPRWLRWPLERVLREAQVTLPGAAPAEGGEGR